MPKGQYQRPSLADRLPALTERNEHGCLLYKGHLDRYGYGQISVGCKTITAHRAVWKQHNGEIEKGVIVGHNCDEKYPIDSKENRRCCEITHLYATTIAENTARMYALGRAATSPGAFKPGQCKGENNLNCKLTWVKVKEIRAKIAAGIAHGKLKDLATEYDVTYGLIQKIKGNTAWKLEDEPPTTQ